ncbi:MAG TPA: NPCBM/NEW2 domain-containing protein, partial [Anaerolineales bacterium]|nr:NPCBM/NEW2 domain-containing protein [Anaerolineales bacterium]
MVDGDTIETWIDGKQVGIGLIGITTPMGNTKCGQEATGRLESLMHAPVRLEEDPDIVFDDRKRRMYYAYISNGQSVALDLVATGHVRANGQGKEKDQLAAAEAEARQNRRGCLWRSASATNLISFREPANNADTELTTSLPSNFSQEVVASGLSAPTGFAFLPDGRILIAQKAGLVRIYKNGSLLSNPFIDIRDHVNDYWDRGLIGVAVDPNFTSNGFVYFLYVYENDSAQYTGSKTSRLSRVTASGDVASPGSEVAILGKNVSSSCKNFPVGTDCIPADWYGHTVGNIKFSTDGTLFASNGDAATWNLVDDDALRSQDLDNLAGKIVRITTSGAGLATNPFWNGDANAIRSKVWGLGLRNAYRFDLRPGANLPYLGDVGWDQWEEINVGAAGVNMGWPCYEGNLRQSGYEPKPLCQSLYNQGSGAVRVPLFAYNHNGTGAAITGGTFYTGTAYPSAYQGAYFYGDYAIGYIRYIKVDNNNNLLEGPLSFAIGADGPVDIQMGPDGNLYYLAINMGELRRIRYTPPSGTSPSSSSEYLSDLTWSSMTNGWGPTEKDMSNGGQGAGDGRVITLNGQTYAKGLGAHAASDVRYALAGICSTFEAEVGVDDEVGSNGGVVFQVWADGTKLYDSGLMSGSSATQGVNVSLSGRQELALIVTDGGNTIDSDHADWANARVSCSTGGGDTTPPTVTSVSPADGSTNVVVTANTTATFSEGMDPTSLNTSTVFLVKQGTTTPIPAVVTYDPTTKTVTLDPNAKLEAGVTYMATVKGGANGVKDLAGNPLTTDKVWSFITSANQPPTATINQPASTLTYKVGDVINYSGSATDPEDGTLPASGLAWQIVVHHCPGGACHTHLLITGSGGSGSFTVPDHGDESYLEIILTATDSGGLADTKSVSIQPQTVTLTLATSPTGLQVVYGGESGVAPMVRTTIVGSSHTIYAPSPQGSQAFASWSDGGTQQHNITVGMSNVTYTATFIISSGTTEYLSDLTWSSMTNGWGPVEKDMSNGGQAAGDGRVITLNGQTYAKGLGAHAASDVRYALAGICSTFGAEIGVDDEVGSNGGVVFQVWADGTKLYDSGLMSG